LRRCGYLRQVIAFANMRGQDREKNAVFFFRVIESSQHLAIEG
jgi:hypothetical protein